MQLLLYPSENMVYTPLNIHYLRMPWTLLVSAFLPKYIKRRFLKIFSILLCKSKLWPALPPWIIIWKKNFKIYLRCFQLSFSAFQTKLFLWRIFNIYLNFCNVFKIQPTLWLSAITCSHDLYKLEFTLPDVASTNVVNFAIKRFKTSKNFKRPLWHPPTTGDHDLNKHGYILPEVAFTIRLWQKRF